MSYSESNAGFGSGSMVIGGAILLILLFGIFGRRGGLDGGTDAVVARNCAPERCFTSTDRDVWMTNCENQKTQAADTAALQASLAAISSRSDLQTATVLDAFKTDANANLRDQLAQERAANLAKDAKIDGMKNQFMTMQQFTAVQAELCTIKNTLGTKLSTPAFIPTGGFARACPTECC